ncbi:18554_t:CDS:1, partial [Gigaspora rosea]
MLYQIALNTGIKLDNRKITNHSACQSAIMILKAADVPENELMNFSGQK